MAKPRRLQECENCGKRSSNVSPFWWSRIVPRMALCDRCRPGMLVERDWKGRVIRLVKKARCGRYEEALLLARSGIELSKRASRRGRADMVGDALGWEARLLEEMGDYHGAARGFAALLRVTRHRRLAIFPRCQHAEMLALIGRQARAWKSITTTLGWALESEDFPEWDCVLPIICLMIARFSKTPPLEACHRAALERAYVAMGLQAPSQADLETLDGSSFTRLVTNLFLSTGRTWTSSLGSLPPCAEAERGRAPLSGGTDLAE